MIRGLANDFECLTNNNSRIMKRVFVLLTVALLGLMAISTNADAKVVRGFVTDQDGNPVEGVRMVVVNEEQPGKRCFASTDADGYFSVQVPDNMDTSEILNVFSQNGNRVVRYRETNGTVRITIEPKTVLAGKSEKLLAQK